jgi:uncharacterized protein involved in exopolysaccharide biosynthesis
MSDPRMTARDLWLEVRRNWAALSSPLIFCLIVALAAGFLLPVTYRSSATLIIVSHENADVIGDAGQGLAGLASLIGLNIPSGSNKSEVLATLRSRLLAGLFITKQELLPQLFPERWDRERKTWKDGERIPKPAEAYERWSKRILKVSEDAPTGLVTVALNAPSPELAASWTNQFLLLADERLRSRAIVEAEKNIQFLDKQLQSAAQVEIKEAVANLLERELKQVMLAKGRSEYAFKVVDPPFVPHKKHSPKRLLLLGLGLVLGVGLTLAATAMRVMFSAGRRS